MYEEKKVNGNGYGSRYGSSGAFRLRFLGDGGNDSCCGSGDNSGSCQGGYRGGGGDDSRRV